MGGEIWSNLRKRAGGVLFIYLFKILKTIQSHTPYKRGAEVKRIHVYKIYLQKVPRNKRNLNKSTSKIIK